jgi:predicted AlkP superfamily phosphohydrolase/phosphomutase
MVVFTLADKIQHCFWNADDDTGQTTSDLGSCPSSEVKESYVALDDTVGEFLSRTDDETTVLIVSDHGFGPCSIDLHPNVWLRERGYFRLHAAHRIRARALRWRRAAGAALPSPELTCGPPSRRVNWRRTRAFSDLYVEPFGIYLNLKGREPAGIVSTGDDAQSLLQTLEAELLESRLPSGKPLFDSVERPQEIYRGSFTKQAPDLVLRPYDPSVRLSGEFTTADLISRAEGWPSISGSHRPHGILFARGPSLGSHTTISDAQLEDIAPTVLSVLNEDIPGYMDGHPLFE